MVRFRFLTILLILLSVHQVLTAQKLFREGYIIRKDGVALEGMIGFNPGQDIPSICIFKRFEIAVQVSYTPGDLKAVGYKNGRRFEVFDIEGKPAFYEALVKGELSLYRKGLWFYISKKDCTPVKLTEKMMELNEGGEIRKFTNVRGILLYLTAGRGIEVKKEINTNTDLVPLVTEFNSKAGSKYHVFQDNFSEKDLVANIRRSGVNKNTFGILAGENYYSFKIRDIGGIYAPNSMSQMWPFYGAFFERVISTRSDKMALRTELQLGQHHFYSFSEKNNYSGTERNDAFIDLTTLKVPVLVQYSFRGSRVVPFINAGITFTESIKRKYVHLKELEDLNHNIYTTEDNLIVLKPFEISAIAGAGISIRVLRMMSIRIEGRIEFEKGPIKRIPNVIGGFKENAMQATILCGISF